MLKLIKKAAGGLRTTTATATHNATDFIAAGARQKMAKAAFNAKPCHGIDQQQYRAVGAVLKFFSVLENTMYNAGNLPDSEVFLRPEFKDGLTFRGIHGFGRDGLVRKAGRMALYMFSTSRPPVALEKATSGLQSHNGAETMTKVSTPTTSKTGNTSPLTRQQAIENALATALYFVRQPSTESGLKAATGRAIRAASMLKQACAEMQNGGAA